MGVGGQRLLDGDHTQTGGDHAHLPGFARSRHQFALAIQCQRHAAGQIECIAITQPGIIAHWNGDDEAGRDWCGHDQRGCSWRCIGCGDCHGYGDGCGGRRDPQMAAYRRQADGSRYGARGDNLAHSFDLPHGASAQRIIHRRHIHQRQINQNAVAPQFQQRRGAGGQRCDRGDTPRRHSRQCAFEMRRKCVVSAGRKRQQRQIAAAFGGGTSGSIAAERDHTTSATGGELGGSGDCVGGGAVPSAFKRQQRKR